MGLTGLDVDDGLALLYLLGKTDVELLGITTVYGNSDVETVYSNTQAMVKELGMANIPVIKGSRSRQDNGGEAAKYIVEAAKTNRGNLSILATGPLTNLYAAYMLDNTVFENVNEIVLMGGLMAPLIINGNELAELNFSCDPKATDCVLKNGESVSVITGNTCLDAIFSEDQFRSRLMSSKKCVPHYILQKCDFWFSQMKKTFKIAGFYNWDVVAAVYLSEPSLFMDTQYIFEPSVDVVNKGFLINHEKKTTPSCKVNVPKISNVPAFFNEVYGAWLRYPT
jgi:purine nucleosidase